MRSKDVYHKTPRVIALLIGDIAREPGARTKYGTLFQAMEERFRLVEVYDATLRGRDRLLNGLITIHPNLQRWRQRFYMNVPAFRTRSQRVADYLHSMRGQADVVFQIGVLFDASWGSQSLPNVIYTDYTAHLSSQQPDAGRSPFNGRQLKKWLTLERQAFTRAAQICTWSDFARASLLTEYQIPATRVTTVGGGVNFARLPKLVRHQTKERRILEERPPTALFIGKDFYRKGGDLLLRAFAQVRRELPNAHLLLLTRDSIPSDLPLAGVEVIAPTWNRREIESLYRRADLLVLPSRLETWGDVLLEAMAYGLPCLGVTGKAMGEIIQHQKTGLLIPPHDVDALASALSQLLRHPTRRREWGDAGRKRVESHFTWHKVVERIAPLIERAARGL